MELSKEHRKEIARQVHHRMNYFGEPPPRRYDWKEMCVFFVKAFVISALAGIILRVIFDVIVPYLRGLLGLH